MSILTPVSSTAVALTVLSGGCVIARLLSRIAFVKHLGLDDCLIALALGASVALTVLIALPRNHEISEADPSSNIALPVRLLKGLWSSSLTYNLALLLLKDSLLLQYLRLSGDIGYQRACWVMGAVITAYGISALFVGIFSCQPISYSWNENIEGGRCIDFLAFWLFNASFNFTTDIIVCVLPIPVLKSFSLPRKQTIALICLFMIGIFVCAASILRLTALFSATQSDGNDPAISLWSTIEINIGIICACIPSLRYPVAYLSSKKLPGRRQASQVSALSSHTSIHDELKNPTYKFQQVHYRHSSISSEASHSQASNIIDFSYFGHGDNTDDNGPTLSNTSGRAAPGTPTSLMFDLESQTPLDTITSIHTNQFQNHSLPLGLPPTPLMPAPVARPARPRASPGKSKVFRMRNHKVRHEPRSILPMACIPESQSPIMSPRRAAGQNSWQPGTTRRCKSSPSLTTDFNSNRNYMHERPPNVFAPDAFAPVAPSNFDATGMNGSNTVYGNIAPWDACPCPSTKTYSYKIVGGPRALERPPTRLLNRRENAKRERERHERVKRVHEEKRDRERRNRPLGPRAMR